MIKKAQDENVIYCICIMYNIIYFKLSSSVLFGLVLVTHWVSQKLQPPINIFFSFKSEQTC